MLFLLGGLVLSVVGTAAGRERLMATMLVIDSSSICGRGRHGEYLFVMLLVCQGRYFCSACTMLRIFWSGTVRPYNGISDSLSSVGMVDTIYESVYIYADPHIRARRCTYLSFLRKPYVHATVYLFQHTEAAPCGNRRVGMRWRIRWCSSRDYFVFLLLFIWISFRVHVTSWAEM